ncbi:MAG: right-handed parallel beta-helix repeat-containing protein [Tahibacter sp.]
MGVHSCTLLLARLAAAAALGWVFLAVPAGAQTTAGLVTVEGYGNLETAGAIATISGDTDRDSSISLQWRRVGDAQFRAAQPLLRIDATHLVGSLFGLTPGSNYEARMVLTDPDGISGTATQDAAFSTRADTLPEPSLRILFVATDGSDGNNGLSVGAPLKTIQHAADLAQAGDLVLIGPGVYREAVNVPRSGTAAQPIVFRGSNAGTILDGASALVDAGGAPVGWSAIGNGVYRSGFDIPTGHVVTEQGRLFRYDSLSELQALAAGAPGGFFYDGSRLDIKFSDNSAPAAHAVHAATLDAAFTLDTRQFVRIENVEIRHYGTGDYGKGVYLRYSSDCVVRNSRIHEIGSAGVWIKGGSRHRIEDNTFYDTSIPNWPWDQTKGSSAENNAVVMTDDMGRGHVIRRNTIYGLFNGIGPCGASMAAGLLTSEVDIYRNSFRTHNDDALEPEGYCSNVRIFQNTVRDSHMAFAVAPASPGPTWFVRNLAWDIGNTRTSQLDGYTSSGLKINSGYPDPVGPILLYQNTFYTRAPATDSMNLLDPAVTTFIRARNNLFVGTNYVLAKTNAVALDWDYDLLYTTDPVRFVKWQGITVANIATLRANYSQELHGVAPTLAQTPGLVSPASGDFRPQSTSLAVDHGVLLPGINDDYFGSAPDIGAYEYSDRIFAHGFEVGP